MRSPSVTDVDGVSHLPPQLYALAPQPLALLDAANALVECAVPPVLLELVRLRAAALIGNRAGMLRRSGAAHAQGLSEAKIARLDDAWSAQAFSATEKACIAFTDQFVFDVTGMGEGEVAALAQHLPAEHLPAQHLRGFVTAVYLTEFTQRLELMAWALLGDPAPGRSPRPSVVPRPISPDGPDHSFLLLQSVLRDYQDAVVRAQALDPVVTELVRLRCARTHDCRICKTLRMDDARAAGVDDAMTAKVDVYAQSDLDERTKTALRITDAFIGRPDTLSDAVADLARSTFSPPQLAELLLDITKWSTQKIHVSLGTDSAEALPKNEQGLSFFGFDDSGRPSRFSATPRSGVQTRDPPGDKFAGRSVRSR